MSAKDILCTYFYTNNFNRFKVITLTISNYGETWGGYFKTNYMKLYTEEQVKEAMFLYNSPIRPLVQQVLDQLTPIELPGDEEIRERAENCGEDDSLSPADEYENGAKWMKEQILNQNK